MAGESTLKSLRVPNPLQTLFVGLFFLLGHLAGAVYALQGVQPSAVFVLINYLGSAFVVAYWVNADEQRLGRPRLFDEGFYLYLAWPLVLPYYLFKSRGVRGAVAVLGFVALYLGSYAISLAVFFALRPLMWGQYSS